MRRIAKSNQKGKTMDQKNEIKVEQTENITMLSAIETILEVAKDSSLSFDKFAPF